MPLDERGQRGFGDIVIVGTAGGLESFEELTVRQAYRGADTVQDLEISKHDEPSPLDHTGRESRSVTSHDCSRLLDYHEYNGSAGGFVPEVSGEESR